MRRLERGYDAAVGKTATLLMLLLFGCAGPQSRPSEPRGEIINDCPAARAAEKELAAREGRKPQPIVQRGRLLSDLRAPEHRARVTFSMIEAAHGAPLALVARISVNREGGVDQVQISKSSGVPAFDRAVMEAMKTWQHLPFVVDCVPFPYIYPADYTHRG
jgi:TonB family protein